MTRKFEFRVQVKAEEDLAFTLNLEKIFEKNKKLISKNFLICDAPSLQP
jgi:hypothetical protein